jgi:hypothetical protein
LLPVSFNGMSDAAYEPEFVGSLQSNAFIDFFTLVSQFMVFDFNWSFGSMNIFPSPDPLYLIQPSVCRPFSTLNILSSHFLLEKLKSILYIAA